MKYLCKCVCWKVFHVSNHITTQAYCCLMTSNYLSIISGEKIQPFLLVTYCYQCSKYTKVTSDHEIPLFHMSNHITTQACCCLITCLLITWVLLVAKKIQPFLLVTNCYQCSTYTKVTSDHEIPLAMCLLKGISCV
jgi:hypothetical protein